MRHRRSLTVALIVGVLLWIGWLTTDDTPTHSPGTPPEAAPQTNNRQPGRLSGPASAADARVKLQVKQAGTASEGGSNPSASEDPSTMTGAGYVLEGPDLNPEQRSVLLGVLAEDMSDGRAIQGHVFEEYKKQVPRNHPHHDQLLDFDRRIDAARVEEHAQHLQAKLQAIRNTAFVRLDTLKEQGRSIESQIIEIAGERWSHECNTVMLSYLKPGIDEHPRWQASKRRVTKLEAQFQDLLRKTK